MWSVCMGFFFFFKQKTAYEMRISDWSSDVCSSDLSPSSPRETHRRGAVPVLKNTRHEAFARALAKGMSADAAYEAAGYKPSRSAASRLSSNVNVQGRVCELLERGARRAEIDNARTLQEMVRLGKIGRAHIRNPVTNAQLVRRLLLDK